MFFVSSVILTYRIWCGSPLINYTIFISSSSCLGAKDNVFVNFLSSIGGYQYNNFKNDQGRTLDLFITNNEVCHCDPAPMPLVPVDSKHPPFLATLDFNLHYKPMVRSSTNTFCFVEGKYEFINLEIDAIDWEALLTEVSIEDAISIFYEKIYAIIKIHIPVRRKKSSNFPIWFSIPLIHIFKNKKGHG